MIIVEDDGKQEVAVGEARGDNLAGLRGSFCVAGEYVKKGKKRQDYSRRHSGLRKGERSKGTDGNKTRPHLLIIRRCNTLHRKMEEVVGGGRGWAGATRIIIR